MARVRRDRRPSTGPAPDLGARLDALLATSDGVERRDADPVGFVHGFEDPADQEVVGLLAAALAFGNVTSIRRSIGRVLEVLGPHPADEVQHRGERTLRRRLDGFVHRVYRGEHVARMLSRAGAIVREDGSLGARFATHLESQGELREALARFSDDLRGPAPDRGLRHLVSDPRAGSACKRMLLYLRWMTRPADGVDLGLWPVHPEVLVIPLDTHIQRIALNLGLTERTDASWRTAEDITRALRRYDTTDPVKYDFALCHLGVSRSCPSRRDEDKCAACVLRPACTRWR